MSTLGAMLATIIVIGLLLAYYVGYAVGRGEGRRLGRKDGKREGAVRAYAVGYDRGRHDRPGKGDEKSGSKSAFRGCSVWLLPFMVLLLAVIVAAAYGSYKNRF